MALKVDKKIRKAIGARFREALKVDMGLSGEAASKALGYPGTSGYVTIRSGRTFPAPHVFKLMYEWNYDLNWLLFGSRPKFLEGNAPFDPTGTDPRRNDPAVRKLVGENMRHMFCVEWHRTHAQAAEILGYTSQSAFSAIVTGRNFPPPQVLQLLHDWNINMNWLICGKGEQTRNPGRVTRLMQTLGSQQTDIQVARRRKGA